MLFKQDNESRQLLNTILIKDADILFTKLAHTLEGFLKNSL